MAQVILSFALLLGLLSSAGAAERVVRVGLFPNITHAQALVAANFSRTGEGWFEKRLGNEVRVDWMVFNAGPSAMEAIFTKAVDFTYVGPSPALNAYARANGKAVRVLAGAMRRGEALVVRPGIESVEDFRGKTIATPQLGNTQDVLCRAWFIDQGFRVTLVGGDVRVVPISNPDIFNLFGKGQIDGAWTVEPWVTRLLASGGKIFHEPKDGITTILATQEALVREQPELAKKFVQAHEELTAWILANPEEAQQRVANELTALTKRDFPLQVVQEAWPRLRFDTSISLEPFAQFLEKARQVGFLRAQVNLDQLIYPIP